MPGTVETSIFVTVEAGNVVTLVSYEVVCSMEVRVIVAPGRVVVRKIVVGAKVLVDIDVYADVITRVRVSVTAGQTLAIFRHRVIPGEVQSWSNPSTRSSDRYCRQYSDNIANGLRRCFKPLQKAKDSSPGMVLVSVSYSVVCSNEVVVTVVPGAVETFVTVKSTVDVLRKVYQSQIGHLADSRFFSPIFSQSCPGSSHDGRLRCRGVVSRCCTRDIACACLYDGAGTFGHRSNLAAGSGLDHGRDQCRHAGR